MKLPLDAPQLRLFCLNIALFLFIFNATHISISKAVDPAKTYERGVPKELKKVGIREKLGSDVDIQNLRFTNEKGEELPLATYFKKPKPVLLALVYYNCPSLCSLVLNGLMSGIENLKWSVGKEFEIVTVSIDHREGPELAAKKKASYLKKYGREGTEKGWHFLTGKEDQILKLADQVGFGFEWDARQKEYAHGAALYVLTPSGKISRLHYGINYTPFNIRLSLLEASGGKVGTIVDRVLFYCYRYDPNSRGYAVYAFRLMQAGGAGTVLVFGSYLWVFWRRQRRIEKVEDTKA